MSGINWTLINDLHKKPHPLCNLIDGMDYFQALEGAKPQPSWCGEVLYEARTAHHILDLAGIPHGRGYDSNVDARTFLLFAETIGLRERLDRIAGWHSRESGPSGLVGDFCNECGATWPCDTRRMADGTHEDLTPPDATSPAPDGDTDSPVLSPATGSGAVDEMDPGPQTGGSGSVRDRSSPRAAGHP